MGLPNLLGNAEQQLHWLMGSLLSSFWLMLALLLLLTMPKLPTLANTQSLPQSLAVRWLRLKIQFKRLLFALLLLLYGLLTAALLLVSAKLIKVLLVH